MSKSTLTRRALVARTAAMPAAAALGLPVVAQAAAEPDPIFALIEDYQRIYAEYNAAIDVQAESELEQFSHAFTEASRKLCLTAPTTLAGLAAVLNFVINGEGNGDDILSTFVDDEHKDGDGEEDNTCLWPFFRTVLRSVEQMAGAQS